MMTIYYQRILLLLQFNANNIYNSLFVLIDQNAVIVHYNKFPNLGVYHAKDLWRW